MLEDNFSYKIEKKNNTQYIQDLSLSQRLVLRVFPGILLKLEKGRQIEISIIPLVFLC